MREVESELAYVEMLRAEVPEPADLSDLERRVRARMTGKRAKPSSRVRRFSWTLVPAGLAATAVTVILVSGVSGPWGQESSAEVDALMARAAQSALHTPVSAPRPDQYLYQRSVTQIRTSGGSYTQHRDDWVSVGGSRPGLIRERNAITPGTNPPARPAGETVLKACGSAPLLQRPYIDALPADTGRLLALLSKSAGEGSRGDRLWSSATDVLGTSLMAPSARASFYRAMAKIPDVTVVRSATDAAGRHGIALTRTSGHVQNQILFDSSTYTFLGERTIARDGTQVSSTAVLTTTVTDDAPTPRPGAAPGGC